MKSESLFITCGQCGKDISKSSKVCAQCGAKQKKLGVIHWVGIGIVVLMAIGILNAPRTPTGSAQEGVTAKDPGGTSSVGDVKRPQSQIEFIDAVTKYAKAFRSMKNELQRSALRDKRKQHLSQILSSPSVHSWVGKINQLETNTEGKAILSVEISPDIDIKTSNNAISDTLWTSTTLIEKDTPVFNSLFNLSAGTTVEFSGNFYRSEEDFIRELSMTIVGSMRNPEFLFKFSSVNPIN